MSGLAGRLWNDHLLPRVIDLTCSERATGRWRHEICQDAVGDVLEIGFGSGHNLPHYPAGVRRVLAVEPSDVAWQRARRAIRRFGRPVDRIGLDGAALDLPDHSVDTVVSAYTMCTIPDLVGALAEIRRVLRPDGALHFVEHGLSPDADVADKQRRRQPRWGRIAGGCHLDRDIPMLVESAGLHLSDLDTFYAPGPRVMRPWMWLSVGRAQA